MEFTIPETVIYLQAWHLIVGYIIMAMIVSRTYYYINLNNHPTIHDSQYPGICAFLGFVWPITVTLCLLSILFDLLLVPKK